ncbi:hypothetical protein DTO021C3_7753 [Paecilomyces variotii]|nr:hypothetical protein DTO021C3_7753 [Paecilomyces variotii]
MQFELRFAHFNDVYHVPSADLLSRFLHLQKSFLKKEVTGDNGLTIFSGDGFSPSLEASVLKGEHMGPVLDFVNVDVACYGNHDFDFGDTRLKHLSDGVGFPWVLSNAFHETGGLLGCAEEYVIREVNGIRVGFFGLAGTDWPSNCENLPPSTIASPAEVAKRISRHLRINEGCDLIIALTHMRLAEDMEVADMTASGDGKVDLFFGGHDHEVVRRYVGDTDSNPENIEQGRDNTDIVINGLVNYTEGNIRIIKSGTDWRGLSLVRVVGQKDDKGVASVSHVELSQYTDIEAAIPAPETFPPQISEVLESIHNRVDSLVQSPLVHTYTPLEGRSSIVRRQETNLGNMIADAVRGFYDTDIAFFNSGAIRCDRLLDSSLPGGRPLRVRDIIDICPFDNALIVKRTSGRVLYHAIENSLGDMHMDGRFLQVSGLRIVATWKKKAGERVIDIFFFIEGPGTTTTTTTKLEKVDPSRMYTVALAGFIARGYDGYTMFPEEETIVNEEAAMTDTSLMLRIFGHGEEESDGDRSRNDHHVKGVERARKSIIIGRNDSDGLPVVNPRVDDRIRFIDYPAL